MKIIREGDEYSPEEGEVFVILYKGKEYPVKAVPNTYSCEYCPLSGLNAGSLSGLNAGYCTQYVNCAHLYCGTNLVMLEECLE